MRDPIFYGFIKLGKSFLITVRDKNRIVSKPFFTFSFLGDKTLTDTFKLFYKFSVLKVITV